MRVATGKLLVEEVVAEDAMLSIDLLRDSVWQVGRRRFVRVAGFGG